MNPGQQPKATPQETDDLTAALDEHAIVARDIRIIALTASAMKGGDHKAKVAGCSGYIVKPIDTRRFPEQVAGFPVQPGETCGRAS
jgi:CheY-like chemotaxis protein